jgi:hypothetical protein
MIAIAAMKFLRRQETGLAQRFFLRVLGLAFLLVVRFFAAPFFAFVFFTALPRRGPAATLLARRTAPADGTSFDSSESGWRRSSPMASTMLWMEPLERLVAMVSSVDRAWKVSGYRRALRIAQVGIVIE